MLYIEELDDYSVRFSDGSGQNTKIFPKTLAAKKDEKDRVWITDVNKELNVLNSMPCTQINIDGTVHTIADNCVAAINAMMSNGTFSAPVTTTTTTAP